jgi:hypothetical protein
LQPTGVRTCTGRDTRTGTGVDVCIGFSGGGKHVKRVLLRRSGLEALVSLMPPLQQLLLLQERPGALCGSRGR